MKKVILVLLFSITLVPASWAGHGKFCKTKYFKDHHHSFRHHYGYDDYAYHGRGCGYWCKKHKHHYRHYTKKKYCKKCKRYRWNHYDHDHDYYRKSVRKHKKYKKHKRHDDDYAYGSIKVGSHTDDGYFHIKIGRVFD